MLHYPAEKLLMQVQMLHYFSSDTPHAPADRDNLTVLPVPGGPSASGGCRGSRDVLPDELLGSPSCICIATCTSHEQRSQLPHLQVPQPLPALALLKTRGLLLTSHLVVLTLRNGVRAAG